MQSSPPHGFACRAWVFRGQTLSKRRRLKTTMLMCLMLRRIVKETPPLVCDLLRFSPHLCQDTWIHMTFSSKNRAMEPTDEEEGAGFILYGDVDEDTLSGFNDVSRSSETRDVWKNLFNLASKSRSKLCYRCQCSVGRSPMCY